MNTLASLLNIARQALLDISDAELLLEGIRTDLRKDESDASRMTSCEVRFSDLHGRCEVKIISSAFDLMYMLEFKRDNAHRALESALKEIKKL